MKRSEPNRKANIWVARGVPVFLLGIIGYASWVITKVLCVDYLLQISSSSSFDTLQTGPAIAILVLYYVLLCMTLLCYARLIYVVTRYPGLVPRGSQWFQERRGTQRLRRSRSRRRHRSSLEKSKAFESDTSSSGNHTAEELTRSIALDAEIQVEEFWQRDVFTCGYDGRPAFCSTCYNWKPDRAHHCSELDRCVLKMDHFCPWVGGVVGETSFKFFIQFTFWAALLCTHVLVSVAYYFAQRRRSEGVVNVHWAVILGISGLFTLFSAGMCMSSLQFAFINSTTIENLSRKRKVWYLAVYIPDHVLQQLEHRGRSNLRTITFPRPPEEHFQVLQQHGLVMSEVNPDSTPQPETSAQPPQPLRTFAILETAPGTNPFDLGWKRNFVDIMGSSLLEWLLPVHPSPCIKHDSIRSFYRMGSALRKLKHEARIVDSDSALRSRRRSSKSGKRGSRSSSRKRRDLNHTAV